VDEDEELDEADVEPIQQNPYKDIKLEGQIALYLNSMANG
jgi:hypothetical protein